MKRRGVTAGALRGCCGPMGWIPNSSGTPAGQSPRPRAACAQPIIAASERELREISRGSSNIRATLLQKKARS
jgi:hypothetical protein